MRQLIVDLPELPPIVLKHLVLDFTGTLSRDGELLDGVSERIADLSLRMSITVMSADTFGKARGALAELPVDVRIIKNGMDKAAFVSDIGAEHVAAIGNGKNDVEMCRTAKLSVAVIGPEGAAVELLRHVNVVCNNVL